MSEIEWKTIPGFLGRYEITRDGDVRTVKLLKHHIAGGKHRVGLSTFEHPYHSVMHDVDELVQRTFGNKLAKQTTSEVLGTEGT